MKQKTLKEKVYWFIDPRLFDIEMYLYDIGTKRIIPMYRLIKKIRSKLSYYLLNDLPF